MEYKSIKVSENDGIARLTLNKPPLNVLDIDMMWEMNEALRGFEGKKLKAVVIDAEGKAFSAGVDISDHTADKVQQMIDVFHGIFAHLQKIEAPTVAFVKGAALGGGCEVALFCDIVLASEKAKFGQPEIKVGVFPPVAAALLPKLIPARKALELLLTGETIRADEAKAMGFASHVLPFENFEEEAWNWVKNNLASKSAVVLAMTKRAFVQGLRKDYEEAMESIEEIYLSQLMKTSDANEGLAAFMQKREPVWKDE